MAKFEVRTEAERFIHNDLSNCAHGFVTQMRKQFEGGQTEGVYFPMMGALVFSAFALEAKVNFVGWKVLQDGWPERANLKEKIMLLHKVLKLETKWGERPLQTCMQLKRLRDTLAHGKPEIIDETKVTNVEPSVWDALKSQWEHSVNPDFVEVAYTDVDVYWKTLLEKAEIEPHQTITHGGHSLKELSER